MARLTVFADDLTGALDSGVKFVAGGAVVVIWERRPIGPEADVVVLDTETRNAAGGVAAEAIQGWARLASGLAYKKMDSTLRGPFVEESFALARCLGLGGPVFAPAFPATGRTVVGGRLLVDGLPVEGTAFGTDPRRPVTGGDLAALIEARAGTRPRVIGLNTLRREPLALSRALGEGSGPVVVDSETDGDLEALARVLLAQSNRLPVGSAGLAGALARALGWRSAAETVRAGSRGPLLLVCGSAHPVNRRQLARLTEEAGVPVLIVAAGPRALAEAGEALSRGGSVTLALPEARLQPEKLESALERLLDEAAALVERQGLDMVYVTGGETLRRLMDRLGVVELRPECELSPGVVQAVAPRLGGKPLMVISKAGGFGDDDLLVKLFHTGSHY